MNIYLFWINFMQPEKFNSVMSQVGEANREKHLAKGVTTITRRLDGVDLSLFSSAYGPRVLDQSIRIFRTPSVFTSIVIKSFLICVDILHSHSAFRT